MDPRRALQLSVDYAGVDPALLTDARAMKELVVGALERIDPIRFRELWLHTGAADDPTHLVVGSLFQTGHLILHTFPEQARAHLDLLLFRGDPYPAAHQVTARLATMSPRMSSASRLTNRRTE